MTDDILYINGGPRAPLPCDRVEPLLSEWADGTLPPDQRAVVETHLDGCERCADLAADLAAIATESRALPQLQPSRDLWAGIAARIEAPVVALDGQRQARLDPRQLTAAPARRWWRTVAAAAALVVVTAGVTWRMTVDRAREEAQRVAQADTARERDSVALPVTIAAIDTGTRADTGTSAPSGQLAGTTGETGSRRAASDAATRRVRAPQAALVPVALPVAAQAYDREIAAMRTIVDARRESLDPRTVRVLERNLKIIDEAIAESRAALAQDPASGLLAEQVTRAMRRKLDLLRTVADFPARTS
jgi:hypothetical protein